MERQIHKLVIGTFIALFALLFVPHGSAYVAAAEENVAHTKVLPSYNISVGQIQGSQTISSEGTVIREAILYKYRNQKALKNPENMSKLLNETSDYAQRSGLSMIAGCSRQNMTEQLSVYALGERRVLTTDILAPHAKGTAYLSGSGRPVWWYGNYFISAGDDGTAFVGIINTTAMQDKNTCYQAFTNAFSYVSAYGLSSRNLVMGDFDPHDIADAAEEMEELEVYRGTVSVSAQDHRELIFDGVIADPYRFDTDVCSQIFGTYKVQLRPNCRAVVAARSL